MFFNLNQFLAQSALKKAYSIIENEKSIKLSPRDTELFLAMLENPPEANKELIAAIKGYKKSDLYVENDDSEF